MNSATVQAETDLLCAQLLPGSLHRDVSMCHSDKAFPFPGVFGISEQGSLLAHEDPSPRSLSH